MSFIQSEIEKTKALAIAMRNDPIATGISIGVQLLAFAAGMLLVIGAAKWAFATITGAF
jgi:carbamoylphosphate synthase small subunit